MPTFRNLFLLVLVGLIGIHAFHWLMGKLILGSTDLHLLNLLFLHAQAVMVVLQTPLPASPAALALFLLQFWTGAGATPTAGIPYPSHGAMLVTATFAALLLALLMTIALFDRLSPFWMLSCCCVVILADSQNIQ